MSVTFAACAATIAYLLPVVVALVVFARRDSEVSELATYLVAALAVDMLLIMGTSRVLPLAVSAVVVRLLWLALLGWVMVKRRRRREAVLSWPRKLQRGALLAGAMSALVAVGLSTWVSRPCLAMDSKWHLPLTASIRGQTVPFANVYEPGKALAYHFSGNALGASLQSLSAGVLHAEHALALAHDLLFGLCALVATWIIWGLGLRRAVPAAALGLAPFLFAPGMMWLDGGGINFLDTLRISYRPHGSLGVLLTVGFTGVLMSHLYGERLPSWRRTLPPLVAITALLAVTDEGSTGLLGLSLGITWLLVPTVLAEDRRRGLVVLMALLVGLLAAAVLCHGTLVSGLGQPVEWVPARAPRLWRAPLPLRQGLRGLIIDLLPYLLLVVAGAAEFLRHRSRPFAAAFVFSTVLLTLGVVGLTCIDVGQRTLENHRFMIAAMIVLPFVACCSLAASAARSRASKFRWRMDLSVTLVVFAVVATAVSPLRWARNVGGPPPTKQCGRPVHLKSAIEFIGANCRDLVNASPWERTEIVYLSERIAYIYAGCRPTYAAGPPIAMIWSDRLDKPRVKVAAWHTKIGKIATDRVGLKQVQEMLPPDVDLPLICDRELRDRLCAKAKREFDSCTPVGTAAQRCVVPARARAKF